MHDCNKMKSIDPSMSRNAAEAMCQGRFPADHAAREINRLFAFDINADWIKNHFRSAEWHHFGPCWDEKAFYCVESIAQKIQREIRR